MNGPDETPRPTTWETFVLASCARLAQFSQVHLAPKFPPGRLNLALRTQLPFLENELLVALIDSDAGGFQNEIVLTTSRLYWSQRDLADAGGRNGLKSSVAIRAYGMDYALIPQGACVVPSGEESVQIALGSGQSLPVRGGGRELAEALAGYLRTVGDAARKGVDPSLDGLDPGLVRRIALVLPKVAEVTRQIRTLNRDLNAFRRDLLAATPHVVVTPLLLAACILVFVVMVMHGVDPFLPSAQQLLSRGANDGARVVLRHEAWRLPASVFIHGGLIHLAVNMWCLFSIGPLVERLFGNVATAVLYLAAGVGGAIASMATLPGRVSVGASGAIFGLLGALLAFLLINRRSVPATVLRPLRSSALSFVVFNTLFAAAVPNIDQWAHMGGLATGFLGGLVLIRPWPVIRSRRLTLRRLTLGLALVGAVLGAGFAAVRWRERTLPPLVRFDDFMDQAAPAIDEFNAVSQALPKLDELEARSESAASSQELSRTLRKLQARAAANRDRLGRIVTPDPSLQSICQALIADQTAQIATLAAGLEYLETRTPELLTGPSGVKAGQAAMTRAGRDFQNRQRAFLETHGLVTRSPDPGR
ncbi:MAG: rhomboid family intramembrane serine protease [Planctomycetaceae bacterium]|nr:rhomboid family intramembrane serine protease [Planctomycetaceae bacterium]